MSLAGRSLNAKLKPATTPGVWQRLELRARPEEPETPGAAGEPLWPALDRRLAAARPCPRLRPELTLKPLPAGQGPGLLLADPAAGRVYRLGEREAALLGLLDGSRDAAALAAAVAPLPVQAVEQFVQDLSLAGLLAEHEGAGLWQRLAAPRARGPHIVWAPAGAEAALAALYRRLRLLFHPAALAVGALLPAAAALALAVRWPAARVALAALAADPWPRLPLLLLVAYLATLPAVLLHELAHALACIHLGGRVSRLGLMVSRLLPAAFADVSDVYFMPRRARVAVYLAGPASTLAWGALAAGAWAWAPPGSFGQMVAAAMAAIAGLAVVTGLNPAAGQDGSDALGEWLALPDGRHQAAAYWRARLKGRPADPTWGRAARTYGLVCLAYNVAALAAAGAALAALLG